ncbi:MAG: hypothetical protein IJT05_02410 [Lachnospiraceae bacterium]|nr:hypothetical protein [Lachnospiraceae bacterium]
MSTAKAAIFDEINSMPDSLDESEIIDSLYHRFRLKQSRESIEEYGTLSTDEVRDYFREKRAKRQAAL